MLTAAPENPKQQANGKAPGTGVIGRIPKNHKARRTDNEDYHAAFGYGLTADTMARQLKAAPFTVIAWLTGDAACPPEKRSVLAAIIHKKISYLQRVLQRIERAPVHDPKTAKSRRHLLRRAAGAPGKDLNAEI